MPTLPFMTPSQAAKEIGCTVQHVRLLIRSDKLNAEAYEFGSETRYHIPYSEVQRYKKLHFTRGQRRGSKLTRKA